MAIHDTRSQRLFVEAALAPGASVELDRAAANYLRNVLRLADGAAVLVFNGRDGEWRARLGPADRKTARLQVEDLVRDQPGSPDLLLLFAPLKHARLDYMAQKATEMGVGAIRPVFTRRTVAGRINLSRLHANVIEAAEQCGILAVPEILPDLPLAGALAALEPDRLLVFCDERAAVADPVAALTRTGARRLAVLIGPEGGFDPGERELVLARAPVAPISLGPRVMRADTAAVAALAAVQCALGDWR